MSSQAPTSQSETEQVLEVLEVQSQTRDINPSTPRPASVPKEPPPPPRTLEGILSDAIKTEPGREIIFALVRPYMNTEVHKAMEAMCKRHFEDGYERNKLIEDLAKMVLANGEDGIEPILRRIFEDRVGDYEKLNQEHIKALQKLEQACLDKVTAAQKAAEEARKRVLDFINEGKANTEALTRVIEQWKQTEAKQTEATTSAQDILNKIAGIGTTVGALEEKCKGVDADHLRISRELEDTRARAEAVKATQKLIEETREAATQQAVKRIEDATAAFEKKRAEAEAAARKLDEKTAQATQALDQKKEEAQKVINQVAKLGTGRSSGTSPLIIAVVGLLFCTAIGLGGLYVYNTYGKELQQSEQSEAASTKTSKPSQQKTSSNMSSLDD